MIKAIDSKKSLPTISLLNTMIMFVLAWDEVADKTVQNCFKKAGFSEIIIIIIIVIIIIIIIMAETVADVMADVFY